MTRPLLAMALCAASPAVAQYGGDTGRLRQDLANRSASDQADLERHAYDLYGGQDARAQRWGRCVVNAVPDESRRYLIGEREDAALRAAFHLCRRDVYGPGASLNEVPRRLAISEALGSTAQPR